MKDSAVAAFTGDKLKSFIVVDNPGASLLKTLCIIGKENQF